MNKQQLICELDRIGLRPSARLGQNFLVDPNLRDALVRDVGPRAGEELLEVGPGTGVLTEALLGTGARVTGVEYDRRLADYLRERFEHNDGFRLIEGDACRLELGKLFDGRSYRMVANLPYSAGTVLLGRLFNAPSPPEAVFVMLQREVANRLCAAPGGKAYGALSVRCQILYRAKVLRMVPPEVFMPPPKVGSAHVGMTLTDDVPSPAVRRRLHNLVRVAFGQRRKQLLGVLQRAWPNVDWRSAFDSLALPLNVRAESISPEQYQRLGACLPYPN